MKTIKFCLSISFHTLRYYLLSDLVVLSNDSQRTDKLKVENKSQSATIKDLTKRLGDVEKVLTKYKENSEKIINWQVAAQAVEGSKSQCFSSANVVC